MFTGHSACAGHCSRHCGYSSEQNKVPAFKELALWRVEIDSKVVRNVPYGENATEKTKQGKRQNGKGWGRVLF